MNTKHLIIYLILTILLGAASLRLSGQNSILIRPRVYLQGALHGLLPSATLMRDDLRAKGLIPLTEPYSNPSNGTGNSGLGGGQTITDPSIVLVTGNNAIVDWVWLELRDPNSLDVAISTRAALLQRDGDVVEVDGVSPVSFPQVGAGNYRVVIRHRNHLGVMSQELYLSETPVPVDFTDPDFPVNCTNNTALIGNKMALWGGNLNGDGRVVFSGPGNDVLKLFTTVIFDPANTNKLFTFVSEGYFSADTNMDGKAIYSGPNNDRAPIRAFMDAFFGVSNPNVNVVMHDCIP